MKKICTLNKIAACGTDRLDRAKYSISGDIAGADGVIVRSAVMHDMALPDELLAIARAGAGVNNIPIDTCSEAGIVVFNTPGANANGVKELVLAGMLLAARDVVGGIAWAKSAAGEPDIAKKVEKEKARFGGCELKGKTLGIIGLGAIGGPLAGMATHLGMQVLGQDSFLTVDAAWNLNRNIKKVVTHKEIFENSDYISLHVPLVVHDDPLINTKHMINKETLAMMRDGVVILNFARDTLVNDEDMEQALKSGKVAKYVTDFPNDRTAGMDGVIAIPHLGASTEESEDNCAVMAADELDAYLTDGIIRNSVNYPDVDAHRTAAYRVCVLHRNIPHMLSRTSGVLSAEGINIETMINKSRKEYAYTVLDVVNAPPDEALDKIRAIDGVIRVRQI
ncbi:MAG: phosphoglycerate dehydrogenase [Oscillospiraceae bacterium]|nr:phosphoglycerate dehydrogenase [Oscillospiraceae bacterium]